MTDGAKEWETIKIEAAVRDDARDDPRTYSDIMRAGLEVDGYDAALAEMQLDSGELVDEIADRVGPVELDAAERRRIAEEVAEVLQR